MIKVALPKGRLGEKAYEVFSRAGYGGGEFPELGRKLTFDSPDGGLTFFWVKPSDVAVYVERGAADVGVVGKDVLDEERPDVYELTDLKIGKCSMCVAGKRTFVDDMTRPLRVATKFVNSAEAYYSSVGRKINVIKLNGSVELAPLLDLSDVIFDIVETGGTLKANGLCVITKVNEISARFIANKSAYKFKNAEIIKLADGISKAVQND